jgi:RHS repeat-associated protein
MSILNGKREKLWFDPFTASASDGHGRTSSDSVTVTLSNSVSFVYDGNGNLLSDGQRNFAYDDENQLISVWVTNVWRSDFAYDGMMRRRKRLEYSWASGTWLQTNEVHYVYDGNLVVQERDANNLARVTYTRGSDLSGSLQGAGGIGSLLARTDNGSLIGGLPSAHAYYHFDGNGNVTSLVNSNGAIVAKYLYDPFGNLLAKAGPLADANLYRFSSEEAHSNSGLIYYGYRFYDPNLERWVNRDPKDEIGSQLLRYRFFFDAPQENLYMFAYNAPINWADVLGLNALPNASSQSGLPNTSSQNCFQNCLQGRRNAPGLGKAVKKYAIGHACGTIGTGVCGLFALSEGGLNVVADIGTLAFGAFEVHELAETADEASKLRDKASKDFARCLRNCARQWNAWDDAYDFWDFYK